MARISAERAERIAKAHACGHCGEYNYKRTSVKAAVASHRKELKVAWQAVMTCGVCGSEQELGINSEGEIVYAG